MFDDAGVLCGRDLLEDEDADEDREADDARHELEQRREDEVVRGDPPQAPANLRSREHCWILSTFLFFESCQCTCNYHQGMKYVEASLLLVTHYQF